MKNVTKTIMSISAAALIFVFSNISTVSAENNNEHKGWIKSGQTVKFIDARDAETGVEIKKDGTVTIRGGVVSSISANTIVVNSTLGQSTLTWTSTIDSNTKIDSKNGKTILYSDITNGDTVTLKGTLVSGSTLSLKATSIRDVSKAMTPVVTNSKQIFEGKLSTISGTSTPTTLTMTIGNTPQLISISSATMLLNKLWGAIGLSQFQIGDTIRVFGFIPTGSSTVNALVLRNSSR